MQSIDPSSRRGFLAGAICGPLSATSAKAHAQARPAIDFADPKRRLRAYMLMRGALDQKLVISCISCRYSGVVDGETTPFYDLVAVTFAKFRPAQAGGYDAVSFEIEYFVDSESGDVLDQWRNPYSGKTVTARHTDSVPVRYAIGSDTQLALPPALLFPGSRVKRDKPRFNSLGDDVWVEEKTVATVPTAGARATHFNELVTYHAKADDLSRPDLSRISADVTYLGVSSFRPWQEMGDRPGHIIGYGTGRSGSTLADLPERWLAITKRRHPEALTDPDAYLEPLWKRL